MANKLTQPGKPTKHNPKDKTSASNTGSKADNSSKKSTKVKGGKNNQGKPGKKKSSSTRQTDNKLPLVLAAAFLFIVIMAGLFVVTNWPAPTTTAPTNPQLEQIPPKPHYPEIPPHEPPPIEEVKLDIVPPLTPPRIAIIIDDLGLNYNNSSAAINLQIPVTCAIIPGQQFSSQMMELAHEHQHEIIVHLPMEPVNYPENNPGELALFTHQSDEELISITQQLLTLLPYASGVNNHMGSAFTQNAEKMEVILTEVKRRHLFFVDSLTIGNSVAYQEAQRLKIPTAKRNVFLDNERDVDKILLQLDKLVSLARTMHSAIGICHPYPETITALTEFSAKLDKLNIEIVPASQLVH